MNIKTIFKRLLFPDTYSEAAYIEALRNKYHVDIGGGCRIWSPNLTHIDVQRPHMLHIGNYVKITNNVTILCHDYSRSVLCSIEGYENIGEAKMTWIGDNVFIGMNTTILMGTHIGNNSIVGAGSICSGFYPDNSVIAGNPAKVVKSIDEYYSNQKEKQVEAAKLYVKQWRRVYGQDPRIEDMTNAFAWLYLPHTKETIENCPKLFTLTGIDKDIFVHNFLNSKAIYSSFQDFLNDC